MILNRKANEKHYNKGYGCEYVQNDIYKYVILECLPEEELQSKLFMSSMSLNSSDALRVGLFIGPVRVAGDFTMYRLSLKVEAEDDPSRFHAGISSKYPVKLMEVGRHSTWMNPPDLLQRHTALLYWRRSAFAFVRW